MRRRRGGIFPNKGIIHRRLQEIMPLIPIPSIFARICNVPARLDGLSKTWLRVRQGQRFPNVIMFQFLFGEDFGVISLRRYAQKAV